MAVSGRCSWPAFVGCAHGPGCKHRALLCGICVHRHVCRISCTFQPGCQACAMCVANLSVQCCFRLAMGVTLQMLQDLCISYIECVDHKRFPRINALHGLAISPVALVCGACRMWRSMHPTTSMQVCLQHRYNCLQPLHQGLVTMVHWVVVF
jgi:hypothetical protein